MVTLKIQLLSKRVVERLKTDLEGKPRDVLALRFISSTIASKVLDLISEILGGIDGWENGDWNLF